VNWHKIYIPLIALALGAAGFGGVAFWKAHEAYRDAKEDARVQTEVRKQLEKDSAAAQTHFDQTGKDTTKQIEHVKQDATKPMTDAEFKVWLKGLLPHADIQPMQTPQGTISAVALTPELQEEIRQKEAECRISAIGLTGCQSQLKDMTTMRDKSIAQMESWKDESSKWEKAAGHGSGFFANVKKYGGWAAIGGLAYLAGRASHK
jgi:hypothetical protein